MIEPGLVFDNTDKWVLAIIEGNVARSARDGQCISDISKLGNPFQLHAHPPALDMKNFILIDVHMLKWDIPSRMHGPLHGEYVLGGGNTAESFASDRIRKRLKEVNCHTVMCGRSCVGRDPSQLPPQIPQRFVSVDFSNQACKWRQEFR